MEYIGPVFTVNNPRYKLVPIEETIQSACVNDDCINYHQPLFDGVFCPFCGMKGESFSYTVDRYLTQELVPEDEQCNLYLKAIELESRTLRFIPKFKSYQYSPSFSLIHFVSKKCSNYTCQDNNHEYHDDYDFCYQCGSKLSNNIDSQQNTIFIDDILKEQKNQISLILCDSIEHYVLHNLDELISTPLFDQFIIDFMNRKEYKSIIKELEYIYGTGTVVVENRHITYRPDI